MSEMARQAFDGPKKFEDCALLDVLKARADKGDHISAGARSLAIMLNEDRAKLQREVAELREVVQELADCEMPEIAWFRKLQGRARDALEAKPHAQGTSRP